MITFADARAIVAASPSVREFFGENFNVAKQGWHNEATFLLIIETADGHAAFDAPDLLVDKATGELREIYGLLGRDPAPDLVAIE